MRSVINPFFLCLCVFLFEVPSVLALAPEAALGKLLAGKETVAVVVVDLGSGKQLFQHNARKALKPASVMKLIPSVVALRRLGPEYTFTTEVWAKGHNAERVAILTVKGFGDPSMTLEQAWILARAIRARGIRSIDRLILDESVYSVSKKRQGQRAYQAQASALALSFNAISFKVCPQAPKDALVVPDPWEAAPQIKGAIKTVSNQATDFAIDEEKRGNRVIYSIRGVINARDECKTVYRSVTDPLRYFGSVFRSYLEGLGVTVIEFAPGRVTTDSKLLFKHHSKPLRQIVSDLNHFSSNFTAEQILFNLTDFKKEAILERSVGLGRLRGYLASLGHGHSEIKIVDASGLSHDNRLSAASLAALLVDIFYDQSVGPEFRASLPVAGRSGTLKNRRFNPKGVVRAKSGSLDGVVSLAGYATTVRARQVAFAVLQNGPRSSLDFEQQLINLVLEF